MSRFWSPLVRRLSPYVAGEQANLPNLVKLNTNENPYGPAPAVLAAIAQAVDDSLRLYPDPHSSALRERIARYHRVQPGQVFVGNGSDEVLAHAFCALLGHGSPVLFPDVSYSFYPVYCALYGLPYQAIALNAAFEVDVEGYGVECGGIVLANPNAPTGIALAPRQIERLLQLQPERVVVIDEAYVDFGAESVVPLVDRYPNLLVVRTLSKSHGLAGLRVGYAIGSHDLVTGLDRVKDSFNSYPLDRLALAGACAAIDADDYLVRTCRLVIQTREQLVARMQALGFSVLPSAANFIFATHSSVPAEVLAASLRERSILVRHFKQARIANYLRISVGTAEQCDRLVQALSELVEHCRRG